MSRASAIRSHGFRVYPIAPLVGVAHRHRWMRRFDFDAEAAVRTLLARRQARSTCARAVPLRPTLDDGGVSHFNLLARQRLAHYRMHLRLHS